SGGGIYNDKAGVLLMVNSTLQGNSAQVFGGGLSNSGTAGVITSTVSRNTVLIAGGGVYNDGTTIFFLSTGSNNRAVLFGGGIRDAAGQVFLLFSTITGNSLFGGSPGNGAGGGLYVDPGATASIFDTIIAKNVASNSPDVNGALDSRGHNLIGDG